MNTKAWLGVIAAAVIPLASLQAQTDSAVPPASSSVPAVSASVAEVIKMAQAGTSEDVLLAYVQNSSASFELTAEQILYLRDIGVSSPVISAMLVHDGTLRSQAQAPQPSEVETTPTEPPPVAAEPAPTPIVQTAAPVYVSNPPQVVSYFYDQLAPYGTWVQLDGVGWCWQPSVDLVNPSWRPYCDAGHWVYTDAGWFWQSDYSWGWAPFHYGRWFLREGCGWVWSPDLVWSPAWVTWRSDGEYCGWAPLPPHADFDFDAGYCFNGVHVGFDFDFGLRAEHFTFISLHDFDDDDYAHHCLPATQVTQIYNHTTVINNYVVNNNRLVNRGIGVERVAAATHRQIRPLSLHEVHSWSPGSSQRGIGRSELAVYRPQLRPSAQPAHMVAQRLNGVHPRVQHVPFVSPTRARPAAPHPIALTAAARAYSAPANREGARMAAATVSSRASVPASAPTRGTWTGRNERPFPTEAASPANPGRIAPHSVNGAFTQGHSGRSDLAHPNTTRAISASSEASSRPALGISHPTYSPSIGSNNQFGSQSHAAAGANRPVYYKEPSRPATQNWFAQQPTHAAHAPSLVMPNRQAQAQWPTASPARMGSYSQPHYSQPAVPFAAGDFGAGRASQVRPAAPVNRTWPEAGSGSRRVNPAAPMPYQAARAPQYYAHGSAAANWANRSYAPAQNFRPAIPRVYSDARGAHAQSPAGSGSWGAQGQSHMNGYPQADAARHGWGDGYRGGSHL